MDFVVGRLFYVPMIFIFLLHDCFVIVTYRIKIRTLQVCSIVGNCYKGMGDRSLGLGNCLDWSVDIGISGWERNSRAHRLSSHCSKAKGVN